MDRKLNFINKIYLGFYINEYKRSSNAQNSDLSALLGLGIYYCIPIYIFLSSIPKIEVAVVLFLSIAITSLFVYVSCFFIDRKPDGKFERLKYYSWWLILVYILLVIAIGVFILPALYAF